MAFRELGNLVDEQYVVRDGKVYHQYIYEAEVGSDDLQSLKTKFQNQKSAALAYDPSPVVQNAEAQISKIDTALNQIGQE